MTNYAPPVTLGYQNRRRRTIRHNVPQRPLRFVK
jgi:hypothetical protein